MRYSGRSGGGAIGCRSTNERLSLRGPDGAYGRVITTLLRLGVDVHHPWVVMH